MTIVAATDTRNAAWAADTSSFGQRMLSKMGWKGDGSGLGKNQQGTTHNLRAVRRADSLGIGAESDAFGEQGFAETSRGYRGVLSKLQEEYGGGSGSGSSGGEEDKAARKRRKKEEKKRKKREEKRRAKNGGSSDEGGGVRLAQNKVQAGHARKMREAKDLRSKSAADMAAVFGVKADVYAQSKDWITGEAREEKDEATGAADGAVDAGVDAAAAAKGERKKAKKRSKKTDGSGSDDERAAKKEKKEKKRRRKEEGASEGKKKRKKDKSKERS